MKLRIPTPDKLAGLSLDEAGIQSPKQHRADYKVTVITPIYGGGVEAGEPDIDMPIRATAIRGQLRFWWRLLQSQGPEKLTGPALFEKERAIWGGMSELIAGEKPKDLSGKVVLRVRGIQNCHVKPCCEYTKNSRTGKYRLNFLHGIPPYAMFPGQGKQPNEDLGKYNPQKDQPHQIILPGLTFNLEVSTPKQKLNAEEWSGVIESIKWWASFGGIGARTRRGLGSIAVSELSAAQLIDPVSAEQAKKYDCTLKIMSANAHAASAVSEWKAAINKLQDFRQKVGVGRNQKQVNGQPVTYPNSEIPAQGGSRWPEPDSIRGITGNHSGPNRRNPDINNHSPSHLARISFPRAAFGLPIIFKFNNKDEKNGDPTQSELRPVLTERMASPLILKAMQQLDGSVAAIALLLPTSHLNSLELKLNGVSNKPDNLSNDAKALWEQNDWDSWPKKWCENTENVKPISENATGIKHDKSDALIAFLNYFGGR